MDFCYSGLKRVFRQIFFYFFYQFVAIEIFEDFDHASAYHRVEIKTKFDGACICFETVAAFSAAERDAKFHAGSFVRDAAIQIHKENIRIAQILPKYLFMEMSSSFLQFNLSV